MKTSKTYQWLTRAVIVATAVIAAPIVVALTNLFYLSPLNPAPWFDVTTVGFAIAAMILDGGVLRYGVLETIPVVRDRVVEQPFLAQTRWSVTCFGARLLPLIRLPLRTVSAM